MSLATNIKDFSDTLQSIANSNSVGVDPENLVSAITDQVPSIEPLLVLQEAFFHAIKSVWSGLLYLVTFQWFRDISYFPLLAPEFRMPIPIPFEIDAQLPKQAQGLWRELVFGDTFLSEPGSHLFSLSKRACHGLSALVQDSLESKGIIEGVGGTNTPAELGSAGKTFCSSEIEYIFSGLSNSFFFSLPFSLPYLISLTRLFSQGITAAAVSIVGTVTAHSLFLIGVLHGLRFLIIPYNALQPFPFFLGVFTTAIIVNELAQERRVFLVSLKNTRYLFRIGVLNFVLALCEETTVFHPFQHLTLNQQNTYLQLYSANSAFDSFFVHAFYLFLFLFGHFFFSFLFCYLLLKVNKQVSSLTGWTVSQAARQIKRTLLICVVAFSLSSFPYYGLDYLFTKIGGFLPEDPVLDHTIFSGAKVKSKNMHFKNIPPEKINESTPFALDLNYFDRGLYMDALKEEKEEKGNSLSILDGLSSESRQSLHVGDGFMQESPVSPEGNHLGYRLRPSDEVASGEDEPDSGNTVSQQDRSGSPPILQDPNPDTGLSFEELNYRGEYAWFLRHERSKRADDNPQIKNYAFFDKPKRHLQRLRLQLENRRAEAALKEHVPVGSISKLKEGVSFDHSTGVALSPKRKELANTQKQSSNSDLVTPTLQERDSKNESRLNLGKKVEHQLSSNLLEPENESTDTKIDEKSSIENAFEFSKEVRSEYSNCFGDTFLEDALATPDDFLPVENVLKKRYLLNPVYRSLLRIDIDAFLARQPAHYKMARNQELNLFRKRELLEQYYNWLRYYSPIETSLDIPSVPTSPAYMQSITEMKTTENGLALDTKASLKQDQKINPRQHGQPSFADTKKTNFLFSGSGLRPIPETQTFLEKLYHQQFKGTITSAKRFFKVTFDERQNPRKNRVLCYDQVLYKNKRSTCAQILENNNSENTLSVLYAQNPSIHEELFSKNCTTTDPENRTESSLQDQISPFLEESNSAPVYGGWDKKGRRFVITNKFVFSK